MKPVIEILDERISGVLSEVVGSECPAVVKPAVDSKFGDYQANGVMGAAKKLKTNPRELAAKIVEKLDVSDICEQPEIAGPGFINLRLKNEFIEAKLLEINKDKERLGVDKVSNPKTIVVDFSGPNIAKQMHVGHLRSTIIGDCISRMLEFLGNDVVRQNHIGDWGTQFGMLVQQMIDDGVTPMQGTVFETLPYLESLYKKAKSRYDEDKQFAKSARECVVSLQNGTSGWEGWEDAKRVWSHITNISLSEMENLYSKLSVSLTEADIRGESFYNDILPTIVEGLKKQGLAVESEGAICVFPEGFKNKEGAPLPFIIQKSDGAFLYATTDLAAMKFRIDELKADTIIYVTDARQGLHFKMLFEVVKEARWVDESKELKHITFGTMLGADGKPFKTRSGENVKLKDLLDEAVERAKAVVEEKNPELSDSQKDEISRAVGIGAVKYADYSNNRDSDYIFSFDKMLAMEGNTAPYMQYAYARVRSIEKKGGLDFEAGLKVDSLHLTEPTEIELAKHLLRYGEAIIGAAGECRPNYLTSYLYELAQKFSGFYNNCPVLKANKESQPGRLLLCDLTARTIRHGLENLLGIEVVDKM